MDIDGSRIDEVVGIMRAIAQYASEERPEAVAGAQQTNSTDKFSPKGDLPRMDARAIPELILVLERLPRTTIVSGAHRVKLEAYHSQAGARVPA